VAQIRLRTLLIIAAALVTLVAGLLFHHFVVRREANRIGKALNQMAAATQARDVPGMVRFISPDYLYQGLTRKDLEEAAQAYFKEYGETDVSITSKDISTQKSLATANVTVAVRPQRGDAAGFRLITRWQFTFARRDGQWLITEVTPLAIDRLQIEDWHQIMNSLRVR
jgi:hypothetical protein